MQTNESRQGVLIAAKTYRCNDVAQDQIDKEKAELAHCSKNPFLLQLKYVALTLLEHETLDIERIAVAILGNGRKDG